MDKKRNIYKTLRQIRGMEVSDLAKMIGESNEYINEVESGHIQPKALELIKYAEALDVTPEFIIHRSTEKKTEKETRFEDYIWHILQDVQKLSLEYDVQVKKPYTHSEHEHADQYAIYFKKSTSPGQIAFVCFADTEINVGKSITNTRNDGVSIRSVKWNTNLQSQRCKNGLTCKQVEGLTGISRRQLEYLEGAPGRINKTALESAVKLAKALHCNVEELMDTDETCYT
jgi:transcriptional regulator with XRE-family HTH domain